MKVIADMRQPTEKEIRVVGQFAGLFPPEFEPEYDADYFIARQKLTLTVQTSFPLELLEQALSQEDIAKLSGRDMLLKMKWEIERMLRKYYDYYEAPKSLVHREMYDKYFQEKHK